MRKGEKEFSSRNGEKKGRREGDMVIVGGEGGKKVRWRS